MGTSAETDGEFVVTVLMADVRGFCTIAELCPPSVLAYQLSVHRAAMTRVIGASGGTVMQFFGDAVMAAFGKTGPVHHAEAAIQAARAMHASQAAVNAGWAEDGLPPFGLGIGVSTGPAAALLLGSDDRLDYSLVGDSVNLAQRIQQWAGPGEIVLSDATHRALRHPPSAEKLPSALVKGRRKAVSAWRIAAGSAVGGPTVSARAGSSAGW